MMSVVPNSILACVDAEIDHCLFSEQQLRKRFRYEQKRSFNELCKNPSTSLDGYALVSSILERIQRNLQRRRNKPPSDENWRWTSVDPSNHPVAATENNESNEVTLERAIVLQQKQLESGKWTYQVPVASGVFSGTTDKRRAIDLVCDMGKNRFDLVELKMHQKAGTPLYAAMEILGYGLVYLASRLDANLCNIYMSCPLFRAQHIKLCVLAPESYYEKCNLAWLQGALNDGLAKLLTRVTSDHVDCNIDDLEFGFEKFPPGFHWTFETPPEALSKMWGRGPVYK